MQSGVRWIGDANLIVGVSVNGLSVCIGPVIRWRHVQGEPLALNQLGLAPAAPATLQGK